MDVTPVGTTISIGLPDLENLMRRVVREVVREELSRLRRPSTRSILDDWSQEGPDDPAGDNKLLTEAMAVLDEYGDKPETWMTWEDFEAEVDEDSQRVLLLRVRLKEFMDYESL